MARKHHRRRRARHHRVHRRRRNNPMRYLAHSHRGFRRRRRHNPDGFGRGVRQLFSTGMIKTTLGAFGGFTASRMIPATLFKQYNNGITGYVLNIGSGLGAAWLIAMADTQAGQGAVIGTGLAVLSRVLVEQFNIQGAGMGDVDFDLGYYVSDRFPYPQGAGGPYDAFPGTPSLLNPPFPATAAAAVRAGAAAAAASLPAANGQMAGVSEGGRWGTGRWG